jgi:hypothetical protein
VLLDLEVTLPSRVFVLSPSQALPPLTVAQKSSSLATLDELSVSCGTTARDSGTTAPHAVLPQSRGESKPKGYGEVAPIPI